MAGDEAAILGRSSRMACVVTGGGHSDPVPSLESHRGAVFAVCLAYTRSIHEAEDATQDVLLTALTKADTLRDRRDLRPWLLQIARNRCIDRARLRRPGADLPGDMPQMVDDWPERVIRLHAAIARLPEGYREVILLYYLDGRSCATVAANLGTTDAAIRQRLVRARLMLHDILLEDEP